jgi:hypothetical protein
LLVADDASAQRWKWDLGIYGGYGWYTPMLDEEDTGLPDDAAGAEVHFDAGWVSGLQIGYNFSPSIGLRFHQRYTDRPVVFSDADGADPITAVNLWGTSLDLLFRFAQPREEFAGMEFLPYAALGLGIKFINPGYDNFTCVIDGEDESCAPFVTGGPIGSPNSESWALEESKGLMGLIGLGADWRLGRSFMLRTEINDQIYKPQVYDAAFTSGTTWTVANDENVSKTIHELAATLGLHVLFGLEAPPPVAVAPPPPPPPVTPPPAPVEETISVCVVDPTAPGGIRMQTATLVENRDTFVVVGGTRTPIGQAVGNVQVATGADWYVRGQPLVMTVGTQQVQYTTYGGSQVISAQDLAYIGTINGFPVYADRDDVADVISEINQLNQSRPGTDLGVLLNDQRTLATRLETVRMLYVPVYSYNCVFQGIQRQEPVTKGGK